MTTLTGFPVIVRRWDATATRPLAVSVILTNRYAASKDSEKHSLPVDGVTLRGELAEQLIELLDSVDWAVVSISGYWRGWGDLEENAKGYKSWARKSLEGRALSVVTTSGMKAAAAEENFAEGECPDF